MATQWLRRAWLLAACASALALAACGGGDIVSQFTPNRVIAFGDAMADLGQNGKRYTVNDGTASNWTEAVANQFGTTLTASSAGGLSYATGNARVVLKPDAAGNDATPTVKEQIDTFLASNSLTDDDLVLVNAGTSDLIVQLQAVVTGAQTEAQMLENVGAAGRALAVQVRRLVDAGGKHVVVVGPYSLGRSPWATAVDQASLFDQASTRFNDQLLVSLVDLGSKVLYVDAALEYNLFVNNPSAAGVNFENQTDVVCNSVDPGPGIGTGTNQVNSNLCTPSTIIPDAVYSVYLWADRVYPTPAGQQAFGNYAYDRIHDRW